jgi:predicted Zn-dependent protease
LTISSAELDFKLIRASALLESDPAAAAVAAGEILKTWPQHAGAGLLLATAARSLGDADAALQALQSLAIAQPDSAVVHLELARAHRAAGNAAHAVAALHRAVELEPNLADGWRELSQELAARGAARDADLAYARYSAAMPDTPWLSEPATALAENRPQVAEKLLRRRLLNSPDDVVAMRMLAQAVAHQERYVEAENLLQACLKLAPGDSAARSDLATLLLEIQKPTLVPGLIARLLAFDPGNPSYRKLEASYLSFIGQNDRSVEIMNSLVSESPNNATAWINYGHELRAAGKHQESIEAYRRVMGMAPTNGAAYWSLANLKMFRFDANDVAAMRTALAREDLRYGDRVDLEFALAKALEDDGIYAESFEHYVSGNALRSSALPYDPAANIRHVQRSREIFTRRFFEERSGWGSQASDPIFIIGLPRSGSTLLEQILASHSRVEGTRELADINAIAASLGHTKGAWDTSAYIESIDGLSAQDVKALADRYLAETRIYRTGGKPRFVDKMPNNFLHVGLIHLMFPKAAIIDARRHPLGCCFSCFKQHFGRGQLFTYDLAKLGRYYRDYVGLMAHVDSVLPGRVHRALYEDVVANLEGSIRKLLYYCKLPFENRCLHFHENRRVVQTASSEQVRRPIFSEGLDHWRHFDPWLGPLKEALGDVIDAYRF